jgi:Tol biopolymer transport system component
MASQAPTNVPRGPYLGEHASAAPRMFAPGLVSSRHHEFNMAFSPAGDELFYTLGNPRRSHSALVRMVRDAESVWSAPEVAAFSGRYHDADPFFSIDGSRLYFISKRPTTADPAPRKDFDIWFVEKTEDSSGSRWGEAVNAGAQINSTDDEFYVSLTRAGTIYFARKDDIHRAVPSEAGYRVEALPPEVNGATSDEFDPYVAPDESFLVFASERPDALGSADLYVSFQVDGKWQPARSLGPAINSKELEYCPMLSPDGAYFFFTSLKGPDANSPDRPRTLTQMISAFDAIDNGLGNVYWMKSDFLETMRAGGPPPQPSPGAAP